MNMVLVMILVKEGLGAKMEINLDKRLIQSIQKIGQKFAIEQIVLFGSRARGDHGPASDIDLAIFPVPQFKYRGRLSSDIDELDTLLKIDVVFIDEHSDPKLLGNIMREGVPLYERSKGQIQ